jgi:hypothetical protein
MYLTEVPDETRKRLMKASFDPARNTRTKRLDDGRYLISSGSQAGIWYEVTASACPCKGNSEHGYCQHRFRASYEEHEYQRALARVAATTPKPFPNKHAAWTKPSKAA